MPERPVRCGHDRPPPARCARIRSASTLLRGRIERRGRLVEQPDRARRRRSAVRARGAAAGRPKDRRRAGRRGRQARPPPSGGRRRFRAPEKAGPEVEVLRYRQRRLQRVLMAEIVGLLGNVRSAVAARERDPPAGGAHQARDQPQQGRFARRRWARTSARASPADNCKLSWQIPRDRRECRPDPRPKAAACQAPAPGCGRSPRQAN